jgi:hypothetical protein
MGRPKSGELYRAKKTGNNWQFHKKGFGTVDTGTADRFHAEQIMKAMGGAQPDVPRIKASDVLEVDVRPALEHLSASLPPAQGNQQWATKIQETQETPPQLPTSAASTSWVSPPNPSLSTAAPTGSPTSQAAVQAAGIVSGDVKTAALASLKKKLSPGKREKLMTIMGGGLARINALAGELALAATGRKLSADYVITDDDLEILKTGYEMGLDELLNNADPEWWHLVITGNLVLAITLAPHVEKKAAVTEGLPDGS